MKQIIEGISKEERSHFKEGVKAISPKIRVLFIKETAIIIFDDDYIVTEETLKEKGRVKKDLQELITNFRKEQFEAYQPQEILNLNKENIY